MGYGNAVALTTRLEAGCEIKAFCPADNLSSIVVVLYPGGVATLRRVGNIAVSNTYQQRGADPHPVRQSHYFAFAFAFA